MILVNTILYFRILESAKEEKVISFTTVCFFSNNNF